MDLGSLDNSKNQEEKSNGEEEKGPEDARDQQEWPEQDMNYMGDKGKGKAKGKGRGIKGHCWGCGEQGHTQAQ
eukprot:12427515-Karenia_brevis.AAC.1